MRRDSFLYGLLQWRVIGDWVIDIRIEDANDRLMLNNNVLKILVIGEHYT